MFKKFKIICAILSFAMFFSVVSPIKEVNALASEGIIIIYENDYISKYIKEYEGEDYIVVLDRINDLYVVNELVYSANTFVDIMTDSNNNFDLLLDEEPFRVNNIDYDELFEETMLYHTDIHPCNQQVNISNGNTGISPMCISCGIGTTVPRTNYNDGPNQGYVLTIKSLSEAEGFILDNSLDCYELLAIYLGVTVSFATKLVSTMIIQGFVIGTVIWGGKTIKQYTHKICPKAIKQTTVINMSSADVSDYTEIEAIYFFSSNPY